MMSSEEGEIPDRDSVEYLSYLSDKIAEEEGRLKALQDKSRITAMEEQLSQLRLRSAELEKQNLDQHSTLDLGRALPTETGIAANLLAASKGAPPGSLTGDASFSKPPLTPTQAGYVHRSKEERETLSKLAALSHLHDPKPAEKITYREFICCMTKVLKFITESGLNPQSYIAHMNFITVKAALNLYATDALIKYEEAVTERVISGQYAMWSSADPECVALHLGADATYSVRQGGSRWNRASSASFGGARDFSDWPKEICWLFNHTHCYFPRCKKAHICYKCKRTGHSMKECKTSDDSVGPSPPEVSSLKTLQKEVKKEFKMAMTVSVQPSLQVNFL